MNSQNVKLMPRVAGSAFYQRLLLAWTSMFAVAIAYCLLRSLVDSDYLFVLGDTIKWAVTHLGAWPILFPVCIYLVRIVERRLSLLAGLIVGMVLAIAGVSLFAFVIGTTFGGELLLFETTYFMAPIAAGTYVVFGAIVFWLSYQSALCAAIDEAVVVDDDTVVLKVWKGQFQMKIDAVLIEWSRAARNYVELHADGKSYLMRASMSELERVLPEGRFLRTHRSYLVNTKFVAGVVGGNVRPSVVLESGFTLPVGKKYRHAVLAAIKQDFAPA
jgi:hypothetical protein